MARARVETVRALARRGEGRGGRRGGEAARSDGSGSPSPSGPRRSREARRGPGARRQAPRRRPRRGGSGSRRSARSTSARTRWSPTPRTSGTRPPGCSTTPPSGRSLEELKAWLEQETDRWAFIASFDPAEPGGEAAAAPGARRRAIRQRTAHRRWTRRGRGRGGRPAAVAAARSPGPGPARRRPAPAPRPALPLGRPLRPPRHAPAPARPLARHAVRRLRPLLQPSGSGCASAPSRSAPRWSAGSTRCPPCAPPCAMAGSPTRRPASSRPPPTSARSTPGSSAPPRLPCIALAREAEAEEEAQTCARGELSFRLPSRVVVAPRRRRSGRRRAASGALHSRPDEALEVVAEHFIATWKPAPDGAEHPPAARPRPRPGLVPGPGLQPRRPPRPPRPLPLARRRRRRGEPGQPLRRPPPPRRPRRVPARRRRGASPAPLGLPRLRWPSDRAGARGGGGLRPFSPPARICLHGPPCAPRQGPPWDAAGRVRRCSSRSPSPPPCAAPSPTGCRRRWPAR